MWPTSESLPLLTSNRQNQGPFPANTGCRWIRSRAGLPSAAVRLFAPRQGLKQSPRARSKVPRAAAGRAGGVRGEGRETFGIKRAEALRGAFTLLQAVTGEHCPSSAVSQRLMSTNGNRVCLRQPRRAPAAKHCSNLLLLPCRPPAAASQCLLLPGLGPARPAPAHRRAALRPLGLAGPFGSTAPPGSRRPVSGAAVAPLQRGRCRCPAAGRGRCGAARAAPCGRQHGAVGCGGRCGALGRGAPRAGRQSGRRSPCAGVAARSGPAEGAPGVAFGALRPGAAGGAAEPRPGARSGPGRCGERRGERRVRCWRREGASSARRRRL